MCKINIKDYKNTSNIVNGRVFKYRIINDLFSFKLFLLKTQTIQLKMLYNKKVITKCMFYEFFPEYKRLAAYGFRFLLVVIHSIPLLNPHLTVQSLTIVISKVIQN